MAGFRKDKTTVAQTAANTAAEVTAALVGAGVIKTAAAADKYFNERSKGTFEALQVVVDADNAMFAEVEAAAPAPKKSTSRSKKSTDEGDDRPFDDPGSIALKSGPFKDVTIAEVYGLSEDEAKETYGHKRGSGAAYIKWLATGSNPNPFTKKAASQFLGTQEDEA